MSDVLEAAGAACLFLVGSELVTRLWGEDKTLAFARGLAVLVVLLGLVGALFTGEWDLELPQAQGEAAGQELRSLWRRRPRPPWRRSWDAPFWGCWRRAA